MSEGGGGSMCVCLLVQLHADVLPPMREEEKQPPQHRRATAHAAAPLLQLHNLCADWDCQSLVAW